jgi:hypothetical protein
MARTCRGLTAPTTTAPRRWNAESGQQQGQTPKDSERSHGPRRSSSSSRSESARHPASGAHCSTSRASRGMAARGEGATSAESVSMASAPRAEAAARPSAASRSVRAYAWVRRQNRHMRHPAGRATRGESEGKRLRIMCAAVGWRLTKTSAPGKLRKRSLWRMDAQEGQRRRSWDRR